MCSEFVDVLWMRDCRTGPLKVEGFRTGPREMRDCRTGPLKVEGFRTGPREMIDESRRNGMRLCDIRMDAPVRRMNVDNADERFKIDQGLQTGDDASAGDGKGCV